MSIRMQQRRGTSEQWTLSDPVLAEAEIGFETDSNKFKVGNGVTHWELLPYFLSETGLSTSLEDYVTLTQLAVANGVATLDATGNVPFNQLGNIIDGAPGALDTLNELAAALGDDVNFLANLGTDITAAETAAKAYADSLATGYDAAGAATTAEAAAKLYADNLAVNYDANGTAATAEAAAKLYADNLAVNYDAAGLAASSVSAHDLTTLNVHGIADTAELATKTYADNAATTAVAAIVDLAPAALDTLNELAAALGDDANFASTVTTELSTKANTSHTHTLSQITDYAEPVIPEVTFSSTFMLMGA